MDEMGQFRDCSEGCQALTELTGAVNTVVATTDLRLKRVEDGVSNFRAFQTEARDFFAEHRATEVEREKQLNKRDQEIKDSLAARASETKDALEKYHAVQSNRQFWLMWAVAVLGAMIAILTFLDAHRQIKSGELKLPKITQVEPGSSTAFNQPPAQDAQIPRMR
jgi:hypothetical protein